MFPRLFVLLLFGSSTVMSEPPEELHAIFESELTERGIEFELREDRRYALITSEGEFLIALDNLERAYARDRDVDAISRFINSLLAARAQKILEWADAQESIFPMIEHGALDIGQDAIARPLSDEVILVLAIYSEESKTVQIVHSDNLETWGVSQAAAWGAAEATLDRIMTNTSVSFLDADDLWLGVIEAHEPHKSSLIRAKSLRSKVEEKLGWPIIAVAPSRGFVYLISKSDEQQLGRVGATVVAEFQSAEYPVSTEVWVVDDDGITAIGSFPTE